MSYQEICKALAQERLRKVATLKKKAILTALNTMRNKYNVPGKEETLAELAEPIGKVDFAVPKSAFPDQVVGQPRTAFITDSADDSVYTTNTDELKQRMARYKRIGARQSFLDHLSFNPLSWVKANKKPWQE